jgi:ELWxxDGT repeat protein
VSDTTPASDVATRGRAPDLLRAADGTLYFAMLDPAGTSDLWTSDGTEGGTVEVADVDIDTAPVRGDMIASGGVLYFAAQDATAYVEQDWAGAAWIEGGMLSRLGPGVLTSFGPALRAPVGRVHWAGTETATITHGGIDGAIRSGERAAEEIVGAEPSAGATAARSTAR